MDIRALGFGITFALIWSSAFTSSSIIVNDASPLAALAIRFFIAGCIGVGLAFLLGQSMRLARAQWHSIILFGLCQNVFYLGTNFVALRSIDASLAAIIASTMPLIVACASWILFRERLPIMARCGIVLGMLGSVLIMWARIEAGADLIGVSLCIFGVIALSVATMAVRSASGGGNLLMVVGLQMLVAVIPLGAASLLFEDIQIDFTWSFIGAFTYAIFMPGLIATWIWFSLVGQIGATRAATFHFLNPVFGVAIAVLILGDTLSGADMLGVVTIAAAIFMVQYSKLSAHSA